MGFDDVLKRRIGPMRDLLDWTERRPVRAVELRGRYFRRALGVEIRARADEGSYEIAGPPGEWHPATRELVRAVAGMSAWTQTPGLSDAELERWVSREVLYHATEDPGAPLRGSSGVLARGGKLARRAAMWPTIAMETRTEIAPMPFMPRGRELLSASLAGLRFASRERGHEVFSATIIGEERTGRALRGLVPILDGREDAAGVLRQLPSELRDRGAKLLTLLDDLTALTDEAVAPWTSCSSPRVTWLGHAAVLVEASGKRILCDPLFFAPSDPQERYLSASRFDPRTLPPIDLVLITHGDNDHLNPTSLLFLPPSTPIAIPKVSTQPEAWQVDLRGVLERMGFDRVLELDTDDSLDLGPVRVTALPFEGEDWDLELPKATWLIEGPELVTYLSADANPSDETWRSLVDRRVDVAFLGVSGCAEAYAAPRELGYGNFYEAWIPPEKRMEWVRHTAGPEESARGAAIFRPRCAFGYAAGGASYIQTAYSDVGDHERFASRLDPAVTRALALQIGVPMEIER